MYCKNCSTYLPDDEETRFCPECGEPLNQEKEQKKERKAKKQKAPGKKKQKIAMGIAAVLWCALIVVVVHDYGPYLALKMNKEIQIVDDEAYEYYADLKLIVTRKDEDGKEIMGVKNLQGDTIVPMEYEDIQIYSEWNSIIAAEKDGETHLFSKSGESRGIMDGQVWEYINGSMFLIAKGERRGLVTTAGEVIIPFDYTGLSVYPEWNVVTAVSGNGDNRSVSLFDLDGNRLIQGLYEIGYFREGVAPAKKEKDGLEGAINSSGQVVIPFEYEYVNLFLYGVSRAKTPGGKVCYLDTEGNEILSGRDTEGRYFGYNYWNHDLINIAPGRDTWRTEQGEEIIGDYGLWSIEKENWFIPPQYQEIYRLGSGFFAKAGKDDNRITDFYDENGTWLFQKEGWFEPSLNLSNCPVLQNEEGGQMLVFDSDMNLTREYFSDEGIYGISCDRVEHDGTTYFVLGYKNDAWNYEVFDKNGIQVQTLGSGYELKLDHDIYRFHEDVAGKTTYAGVIGEPSTEVLSAEQYKWLDIGHESVAIWRENGSEICQWTGRDWKKTSLNVPYCTVLSFDDSDDFYRARWYPWILPKDEVYFVIND